jgi:hypothetical protein
VFLQGLINVGDKKLVYKKTPNSLQNIVPVVQYPDVDLKFFEAVRAFEIIKIWKETGLREILINHINTYHPGKKNTENKQGLVTD